MPTNAQSRATLLYSSPRAEVARVPEADQPAERRPDGVGDVDRGLEVFHFRVEAEPLRVADHRRDDGVEGHPD